MDFVTLQGAYSALFFDGTFDGTFNGILDGILDGTLDDSRHGKKTLHTLYWFFAFVGGWAHRRKPGEP